MIPYARTYWLDQVSDHPTHYEIFLIGIDEYEVNPKYGTITIPGTPMDASHFNLLEAGVFEAQEMILLLSDALSKLERDSQEEIFTVSLTNTKEYPFNDSTANVLLDIARSNLNYHIWWEVSTITGGFLGDVNITSKALTGFTIAFDGDATAVTLSVHVEGGF